MGKNFRDIYGDTYVALPAGYGIEGGFPIDLRTVLPGTTMLENLIHNGMVYEGMLTYIAGTVYICKPKFHTAVWNPDGDIAASMSHYYTDEELTMPVTENTASGTTVYSNWLWYEEYQVTAQQVEAATEAAKLDHDVVINGKSTNKFEKPAGQDVTTIDFGLFTPETINAGTDINTITHCGFYSCTDGANSYSLLIEKIGNKLYRTKITIENGVAVVSTSIGTPDGDTVTWDEWTRLGIGKCITTCTSQSLHGITNPQTCVALHVKIGSTPELWAYSDNDNNFAYPIGYPNILTDDGQLFTIAQQTTQIKHPFVVKLKTDNNGVRTATVESLKAANGKYGLARLDDENMRGRSDRHGFVKLSDAINNNSLGENNGVAATPKAVYDVNADLSTHKELKGNSSTYGHVALSDATNSTSDASANIAATPKAVKDAVAAETSARATADANHAAVKGTSAAIGHVKVSENNGLSVDENGTIKMAAANATNKGTTRLTNDIRNTAGESSGYAATPKAVYAALTTAIMGFMGLFKSQKSYFGECSGTYYEPGGSTPFLTITWLYGEPASFNTNDLIILKFTNTFQLTNKFIKTTNGNTYIMGVGGSGVWDAANGEIWSFIYKTGIRRINGESLIIQ